MLNVKDKIMIENLWECSKRFFLLEDC